MANVLTIGELLMRMTPLAFERLSESREMKVYYGGAEVNTAVALSGLGHNVALYTDLPDNELGDGAIRYLKGNGIDTSFIERNGDRLGIYYIEQGFSLKPANVIYDRKNSSVLELAEGEKAWDKVFKERDWLHISGITPALSESMTEFTLEAVKEARKHHVKVSLDFNYRSKLWRKEEAAKTLKSLLPYVDHCFAGWKDFALLFGWTAEGRSFSEQLTHYYNRLTEEYGNKTASSTNRVIHNNQTHEITGYFFNGEELTEGEAVTFDVADRIGGGDSFAAGVLHGMLTEMAPAATIRFATALSVLNHFVNGDNHLFTTKEVENFFNAQNKDVSR